MIIEKPERGSIWIDAEWDAPAGVQAGFSLARHASGPARGTSFNLATHTGEDRRRTLENRMLLRQVLELPAEPFWLRQVHGNRILRPGQNGPEPEADGAYARTSGLVLAVLTADCIPVLLCNREGSEIGIAHAGWRGLCHGVLENALHSFEDVPENILAWFGPHICPLHYEVGAEVFDKCRQSIGAEVAAAFSASRPGHWLMNLGAVAALVLNRKGVTAVYESRRCTYEARDILFSHRRNRDTGRIASLLWIAGQ